MNLDGRKHGPSSSRVQLSPPHASPSSGFVATYQGAEHSIAGSSSYGGRVNESERVASVSETERRGAVRPSCSGDTANTSALTMFQQCFKSEIQSRLEPSSALLSLYCKTANSSADALLTIWKALRRTQSTDKRNFTLKFLLEIACTDARVPLLRDFLLRSRRKGSMRAKRWQVLASMHSGYADTSDKSRAAELLRALHQAISPERPLRGTNAPRDSLDKKKQVLPCPAHAIGVGGADSASASSGASPTSMTVSDFVFTYPFHGVRHLVSEQGFRLLTAQPSVDDRKARVYAVRGLPPALEDEHGQVKFQASPISGPSVSASTGITPEAARQLFLEGMRKMAQQPLNYPQPKERQKAVQRLTPADLSRWTQELAARRAALSASFTEQMDTSAMQDESHGFEGKNASQGSQSSELQRGQTKSEAAHVSEMELC